MTLSDIINPHLVDAQLRQAAIERLRSCSSATSTYALDTIFIILLRNAQQASPPSTTYRAMFGTIDQPTPLLNERGIRYWFWSGLCNANLYPVVHPRIPDQPHQPAIHESLLALLVPYPIDVALQTWIAISIQWLQICDPTWFFNQAHDEQVPSEADIPRHIAGMMALLYY
jgi:hypothetical protein